MQSWAPLLFTETGYRVTGSSPAIAGWFSNYLYSALTSNNASIGYVMFWNNSPDGYYVPVPGASDASDFITFANKAENSARERIA